MERKEAMKILKDFHDKSALFSVRTALDTIIPELKESEDERIRKALIAYFDDANKADENPLQSYGIHTDKAITWLERQCEQKPYASETMNEKGDFDRGFTRMMEKEQKPVWSEEDNNCLSTIIAEFSKCAGKSVSKDEWMRCNDFLNSLRDRVLPQSKQEVNLEKEIDDAFLEDKCNITDNVSLAEFKRIAKYFFELGLSASNPITATDRGTAEEIIVNLKRVEQDYHIDLTREMEWVRNKAQKGE